MLGDRKPNLCLIKLKRIKKKKKSKFTNLPASEQDKSNTVRFYDDVKSGVTVCSLYDRWNDRTFVARTRVHDVDQYDQQTGRAIAFNKARRKELLNDIAELQRERELITRRYEAIMNRIDKNEGLKHIYLAGVNDELNELMGYTDADEDCNVCDFSDGADGVAVDAQVTEKSKEDVSKIKLTQFAKLK